MKVFKCPICGATAIGRRDRVACSKTCAQAWLKRTRGADYHHNAGKVAGRASGLKTKERCEQRRRERWPGVPPDASQAIYTRGYNSGHSAGRRLGFQQGYEAARSGLRLGRTA